jgi:hypothetical protein
MRKRKSLDGGVEQSPPTVAEAVEVLDTAYSELTKAASKIKRREAAEKGWLAARLLAQAVLACANEDWRSPEGLAMRLRRTELKLDPHCRPWLDEAIRIGRDSLHGQCFYTGAEEACQTNEIRAGLDKVKLAIPRAKRLCTIGSRKK